MLKIRFQRVGRTHEPVFRLVLTDSKNGPKAGKTLEVLGSYDSRKAEKAQIDGAKVKHWLSKGAQASDTVHNLLLKLSLIEGTKRNVLPKKIIEAARLPAPEVADNGGQAKAPKEVPIVEPTEVV